MVGGIQNRVLPTRSRQCDGRTLGENCGDPNIPLRVKDEILRWHSRTANMRGEMEPFWEMDFPDGDMIGEILEGPYPAERMEAELFTRLEAFRNKMPTNKVASYPVFMDL